jgi:hypothetical protein
MSKDRIISISSHSFAFNIWQAMNKVCQLLPIACSKLPLVMMMMMNVWVHI